MRGSWRFGEAVILTDTSTAMIDLSVPGVVETHPFGDVPGCYVVLDDVGCGEFP